ncbi:MAG: ATP-binding protein [Deltaproteobacteria bacterium]|nr:ATP-binding protein [Deltaproteobacteria bacterium]
MSSEAFRLSYSECRDVLAERLEEPAPGRIQLLAGPRQVGKTTLLLELVERFSELAVYAAADEPGSALPGFWERLLARAEQTCADQGRAILLLDEAHLLADWAPRLKGAWDRFRRIKAKVHVVASGSSSLHLARGSRESLAGRFELLTLTHWSARSMADVFGLKGEEAAEAVVRAGSYPGAFHLLDDPARWSAYVRDAILEPAIGRDILALTSVRRPALLRQIFAVAASSPAQILSLQKIQGQLQDSGALETIACYLQLLEDAFLVAALPKFSAQPRRQRAAPPKLVTLNNALLAAVSSTGPVRDDPARFGAWVENACLAHAWNAGQRVSYWREEPLEVDGVVEGSWGKWAIEVKTADLRPSELRGLLELTLRYPKYKPLVVCSATGLVTARQAGVAAMTWQSFLLDGPPR